MTKINKINKCRVCGNRSLVPVIDLGEQYLSSVFPTDLTYHKTAKKYPLSLVLCKKKKNTCGTLQLSYSINLDNMYKFYPYQSSTNSSMRLILKQVVDDSLKKTKIKNGDTILDIGGNDGTLLSFFKDKKADLLTIDPAENIKQVFKSPRYKYINGHFNKNIYNSSTTAKAKLIYSIAMFYHLSNPVKFAEDVSFCLDEQGIWVIQMAYLPLMLKTNMYDNIVHEHAGYYTLHNMIWIMEKAGLEVFDVQLNNVYGGSFRVYIKKTTNKNLRKTKRLASILKEEENLGVNQIKTYRNFMKRIEKTKEDLNMLIKQIHARKETIWIYGASTKGNTILQFCEITSKDIVAAADSNPFKFGKFIIGSDIRITNEKTMRNSSPDYLLVLPYSFISTFIQREKNLLESKTKFIIPLPDVKILPD